MKNDPPIERLHELFIVDSDGVIFWRKSGKKAGWHNWLGYRLLLVDRKNVFGHRIVWAMAKGSYPQGQIDHINGVKDDNRIENLRDVTGSQNRFNVPGNRSSKSGLKNVKQVQSGRWAVHIEATGKTHWIGKFPSKELAYEFACLARFHIHGEFAHD